MAAIKEASELVPNTKSELAAVVEANSALIRVEDDAFALVRQARLTEAWKLLNGDEYRRHKSAYASGLTSFSKRLKEHSESAIAAAHREAMWFLLAAICLGGLVALILLVGINNLFQVLRLKSVPTPWRAQEWAA